MAKKVPRALEDMDFHGVSLPHACLQTLLSSGLVLLTMSGDIVAFEYLEPSIKLTNEIRF